MSSSEFQLNQNSHQKLALFGRFLMKNGMEIPCQATRFSSQSTPEIDLVAAFTPRRDEHLVIYMDNIGRIEGVVNSHLDGGFSLAISAGERKVERLKSRIKHWTNNPLFAADDLSAIHLPSQSQKNATLKLEDGRAYPIEIIDISISGATVSLDVKPAIASWVTVAGMKGQVARHVSEGIVVEFRPQAEDNETGAHQFLSCGSLVASQPLHA